MKKTIFIIMIIQVGFLVSSYGLQSKKHRSQVPIERIFGSVIQINNRFIEIETGTSKRRFKITGKIEVALNGVKSNTTKIKKNDYAMVVYGNDNNTRSIEAMSAGVVDRVGQWIIPVLVILIIVVFVILRLKSRVKRGNIRIPPS
jgi:hypothetical protein